MSDWQVTLAIAIVTAIFTAGGILTWARLSINQLEKDAMFRTAELREELKRARADLYRDINGLGASVRRNEEGASRRHHNISLALIVAAPQSKETELCDLLREGT